MAIRDAVYRHLFALAAVLVFQPAASAQNIPADKPASSLTLRDRAWLQSYVTRPIDNSQPRNREILGQLDNAKDLLNSLRTWKAKGEWRAYATVIGQAAFAYRTDTPGRQWYHNADLRAAILQGYEDFKAAQRAEGLLPTDDCTQCGQFGHEAAWRLEPLLYGYLWFDDQFSDEQKARYSGMLSLACSDLRNRLRTSCNNQGTVWITGLALCGAFTGDVSYRDLVRQYADYTVRCAVDPKGQIIELEGGPDANYSYVTYPYFLLFRDLADDPVVQARLERATPWAVQYVSAFGDVLTSGSAVRRPDYRGDFWSLVPGLERLTASQPFLGYLSDRFITNSRPTFGNFGYGGIAVHPLIWSLLEPRNAQPSLTPTSWYFDFSEIYENVLPGSVDQSYGLFSRAGYRTGLAFSTDELQGDQPNILRGLQTFALEGEHPFLHHFSWYNYNGILSYSWTEGGGVNSSTKNVKRDAGGYQVHLTKGDPISAWGGVRPTTVQMAQGNLTTLFAFTPVSMVAVYGGVSGPIVSHWSTAEQPAAVIDSTGRVVSFPGTSGRLIYFSGTAEIAPAINSHLITVTQQQAPAAYGFSDSSFRFGGFNAANGTLSFSDSSASCVLSTTGILNSGSFDRATAPRLTCVATSAPDRPLASLPGGHYDAPITVSLINRGGGTIRYTTDGSEPQSSSAPYSEPLTISASKLLRAKAFLDSGTSGEFTTSYAIGDLLLRLPFEESSGPAVVDISANSIDGTIIGTAVRGAGIRGGRAVLLSGAEHIVVPHRLSLGLDTGDFSASMWVKINSPGSDQVLFSKGDTRTTAYSPHVYLRYNSDGSLLFITSGSRSSQYLQARVQTAAPLSAQVWHHLAAVRQAGSLRIYVDGVLRGEQSGFFSDYLTNGDDLLIGARMESGVLYDRLRGSIDQFELYSHALSEAEIKALVDGTDVNPAPPAPRNFRVN